MCKKIIKMIIVNRWCPMTNSGSGSDQTDLCKLAKMGYSNWERWVHICERSISAVSLAEILPTDLNLKCVKMVAESLQLYVA